MTELDDDELMEAFIEMKKRFKIRQKRYLESMVMGDQIGGVFSGNFDQSRYIQNHVVRKYLTEIWLDEMENNQ